MVVNPRHTQDVANATGRWLRRIASRAGTRCGGGAAAPRLLLHAQTQALSALLTWRRQVVQKLTAERRRLQNALKQIREDIQAHLAWLERRLASTDDEVMAIRSTPLWRAKAERLRRTTGARTCGPVHEHVVRRAP
jgi:transposase